MAGVPMELLTGGSGMYQAGRGGPSIAPQTVNGSMVGAGGSPSPHLGPVAIVLVAVLLLIVLDRAGFRFAVTAGRR